MLITPLQARFIERGKKPDFLSALQSDIAHYDELVSAQQSGSMAGETSTHGISRAVEALIDAIEDLDDIMDNVYEDDPEKFAAWNRASALGTIPRNPGNATPLATPVT